MLDSIKLPLMSVLAALIAYAINVGLPTVALTPNTVLSLSGVVVISAAATLGPWAGLLVGLGAGLGHPWVADVTVESLDLAALWGIEGWLCGYLIRHTVFTHRSTIRLSITLVVALFWLAVGLPWLWVVSQPDLGQAAIGPGLILNFSDAIALAVNAVLNAGLAEFAIYMLLLPRITPTVHAHAQVERNLRWSLNNLLLATLSVAIMLLVIVAMIQIPEESIDQLQYIALGAVGVIVAAALVIRAALRSLSHLATSARSVSRQLHRQDVSLDSIVATEGFQFWEVNVLREAILDTLRDEARSYQAAAAAGEDYQKIIQDANAPIVVINMTGAIIGWNNASIKATGLSVAEVIGKKTEDVLIDSIPKVSTERILNTLLKGGTIDGLRLSFKNTDGRRITLLLGGVLLNDVNGEPDRLIMVGQNLTDYLEKEQQLLQASKMSTLGEMATGIAHELNQPLNAIRLTLTNIANIITRKPEQLASVDEKIERINGQIDRASKIINHLRLYGRRSDVADASSGERFDPDATIDNALSLFQEQFRLANINLLWRPADQACSVRGDNMLFEQVLVNLLSNARDAIKDTAQSAQSAEITITARFENDRYCLRVEDTGGGAEPHVLAHMFEPFYTSKAPGQGTGLGLSIAYTSISNMGGSIRASNSERGLEVVIDLPARRATS